MNNNNANNPFYRSHSINSDNNNRANSYRNESKFNNTSSSFYNSNNNHNNNHKNYSSNNTENGGNDEEDDEEATDGYDEEYDYSANHDMEDDEPSINEEANTRTEYDENQLKQLRANMALSTLASTYNLQCFTDALKTGKFFNTKPTEIYENNNKIGEKHNDQDMEEDDENEEEEDEEEEEEEEEDEEDEEDEDGNTSACQNEPDADQEAEINSMYIPGDDAAASDNNDGEQGPAQHNNVDMSRHTELKLSNKRRKPHNPQKLSMALNLLNNKLQTKQLPK